MKINAQKIANELEKADKSLKSKSINPVLQYSKIDIFKDKVLITSTDLETTIVKEFKESNDQEISFLIKRSEGKNILKSFEIADFEIKENEIDFFNEKKKMTIPLINISEFPETKIDIYDENKITIDGNLLKSKLLKVIPFSAKEDQRYLFNTVYFLSEGNRLNIIASDTKRLCKTFIDLDENLNYIDAIIPIGFANTMTVTLNNNKCDCFIENKKIIVQQEDNDEKMSIISNLVEGKFPDYKMVIPKNPDLNFTVKLEEFQECLKNMSIFIDKELPFIIFNKQDGYFDVKIENNKGRGNYKLNYIDSNIEKKENTGVFKLNLNFLKDTINLMPESVNCQFIDTSKPFLFENSFENIDVIMVPAKI